MKESTQAREGGSDEQFFVFSKGQQLPLAPFPTEANTRSFQLKRSLTPVPNSRPPRTRIMRLGSRDLGTIT